MKSATTAEIDALVGRWVRDEIRSLSAYHVPEFSGMIKLDAMENPYVWPPDLRREWANGLSETSVNRYPDPRAQRLRERLRQVMGVPEGQEILLGNGSDELIQMIIMALGGPDRSVLSVEPGFVMYRMISLFAGTSYRGVDLVPDDFGLDLPMLLEAIEEDAPAVIFIAYPNNPTGQCFDAEQVRSIIAAAPGLVVVDEAYAPFAGRTMLEELGSYPNLLVMRTLSKLGLAGLRLGFLVGAPEWLVELDKVRLPYNINTLTQFSADFALRHYDVLEDQASRIRAEREILSTGLSGLRGTRVFPSDANFVLCRMPEGAADDLHRGLIAQGILVKNLHRAHPSLTDCLRITVGLPEENRVLVDALGSLLG